MTENGRKPREFIQLESGKIIFSSDKIAGAKREANREKVASQVNTSYPKGYVREEK